MNNAKVNEESSVPINDRNGGIEMEESTQKLIIYAVLSVIVVGSLLLCWRIRVSAEKIDCDDDTDIDDCGAEQTGFVMVDQGIGVDGYIDDLDELLSSAAEDQDEYQQDRVAL